MVELDSAFIQAVEHRPKPRSIEAQNIPLIDLSPLNSASLSALAAEIGCACRDWGFFQVINHGVPPECGEKVESASKKFFALPETEKMKVSRDAANPFGYYDGEHTKNVRDWKEVFDFAVENPIIFPVWNERGDLELRKLFNQWPQSFPELREACEEHAAEMEKLAFKLLELVALSLGLPKDRFNSFFKDQTTRVRLNHYPPCPAPDLALGLGRHKDTGVLTILAQDDVPGLEVKRKTDGEWILVKPTPRAYIINVGDILQVWSNDEYESVEHRVVVNAEKERFSIPYFLYPAHYTLVEPLGEMTSEENPAKFKGYNWGEFRATRNRGHSHTVTHSDEFIRRRTVSKMLTTDIPPNQTIYIRNVNEKIKKEELKRSLYALFSQYGRILDIVALKTPKLRGQAWVVFSEVTAASNAVRQMQNFQFYEKPLRIQYAKSKSDCIAKAEGTYDKKKKQEEKAERKKRAEEGQPAAPAGGPRADSNGGSAAASRQGRPSAQEAAADPNNILFIQNLPYETNSMMLELLFKQYPGFREVRMVDAKPGIAFVEFEDDSQSSVAMQDLQGFKINPQNAMVITYAKK